MKHRHVRSEQSHPGHLWKSVELKCLKSQAPKGGIQTQIEEAGPGSAIITPLVVKGFYGDWIRWKCFCSIKTNPALWASWATFHHLWQNPSLCNPCTSFALKVSRICASGCTWAHQDRSNDKCALGWVPADTNVPQGQCISLLYLLGKQKCWQAPSATRFSSSCPMTTLVAGQGTYSIL